MISITEVVGIFPFSFCAYFDKHKVHLNQLAQFYQYLVLMKIRGNIRYAKINISKF